MEEARGEPSVITPPTARRILRVLLVAAVLAVYAQTLRFGFVS